MLGTVIFYTAFLSTVLPINGLHDNQLDEVVRLLESQIANAKSSSEETSESDIAQSLLEDKIKTMYFMNLIQQTNANKKTDQHYNNAQRFQIKSNALNQLFQNSEYDSNRNNRDNYGVNKRILTQFLKAENTPSKNTYHQRLTPNRLLNSNLYQYYDEDKKVGTNEYSKIFVILDPIGIKKSKNTGNLPNLLSRILAQTSTGIGNSRQDFYPRVKGLKDNSKSRRYRRDSKEMYGGGGGDMDDDYRPKRSRTIEYSGGGGGGGRGRTAIPYIRHRGNIYEKDH